MTTIPNIFKLLTIRKCIFQQQQSTFSAASELTKRSQQTTKTTTTICIKGKIIIERLKLRQYFLSDIIIQYNLPWDFIKHYLPNRDDIGHETRNSIVVCYAEERKSDFTIFKRLLEWAFNSPIDDFQPSRELFHMAAENGNLQLLQYLHDHYPRIICTLRTIECASNNGHYDIIQFLIEKRKENYGRYAIINAANGGHLNCLKYLYNNNCHLITKRPFNNIDFKYALERSIRYGHLDTLKFILSLSLSLEYNQDTIYEAANYGHLEVIKTLIMEQMLELDDDIIINIIRNASHFGRWDIVEYFEPLLSSPLSFPYDYVVNYATIYGQLDRVKILHERFNDDIKSKCQKFIYLSNEVMVDNRLDILQYLTDQNYKFGIVHIEKVVSEGKLDMFRFLLKHHSSKLNAKYLLCQAAEIGSLEDVKYLNQYILDHPNCLNQGKTKGNSDYPLNFACRSGNLELVKYINENSNYRATKEAMDNATMYGHFEIVKYLHENRSEGCSKNAFYLSCYHGYLDIFEFLYLNYRDIPRLEEYRYNLYKAHPSILPSFYSKFIALPFDPTKKVTVFDGRYRDVHWESVKQFHEQGIALNLPNALFGSDPIKLLLIMAIKEERLDIIEWLHQHYPMSFTLSLKVKQEPDLQELLTNNLVNLKIIQYLYNNNQFNDISIELLTKILCKNATLGNTEIMDYLIDRFDLWSNRILVLKIIESTIVNRYNYLYTIKLLSNKLDQHQQKQKQQQMDNSCDDDDDEVTRRTMDNILIKSMNNGHFSIVIFWIERYYSHYINNTTTHISTMTTSTTTSRKLKLKGDLTDFLRRGYIQILKYLYDTLGYIDIFDEDMVEFMEDEQQKELEGSFIVQTIYEFYLSIAPNNTNTVSKRMTKRRCTECGFD